MTQQNIPASQKQTVIDPPQQPVNQNPPYAVTGSTRMPRWAKLLVWLAVGAAAFALVFALWPKKKAAIDVIEQVAQDAHVTTVLVTAPPAAALPAPVVAPGEIKRIDYSKCKLAQVLVNGDTLRYNPDCVTLVYED